MAPKKATSKAKPRARAPKKATSRARAPKKATSRARAPQKATSRAPKKATSKPKAPKAKPTGKIQVFGESWCPWSVRAAQEAGVVMLAVAAMPAELKRQTVGYRTVPLVFLDGKFKGGYTELQKILA